MSTLTIEWEILYLLVTRGLLSNTEVLEDIIQRFLTAYLSTGDFSQFFQHHLEVFGYDIAAHAHVH